MQELLSSVAANKWLWAVGGLLSLTVLAWASNILTRRVFLGLVNRVASRTKATWDDRIIERRVFHQLANIAPALVTYAGIGWALGVGPDLLVDAPVVDLQATTWDGLMLAGAILVRRVSLAWVVVALTTAAGGLLNALNDIYTESYSEAGNRPIKGYLQVVSLFLYVAAGIVVISILADRSPVVFLSGLGALTAVLMLVFRDTILSLVASIQIVSNDMIRIGDWIEMPQANADGDVIDIALHTVKIQNWDKTISAIPTSKFISESFKNWRGMSESGGRRISRAFNLDMNSIHFLSDEEVARFSCFEFLHDYLKAKRKELDVANDRKVAGEDVHPEQRRLTNVGTFRAYVLHYLRNHPKIHQGMTLLVRQRPPGPQGLPLEIYCFSNDTVWANYEDLQADIFDHLIATLPEFGLQVFQEPTGSDLRGLRSS
ncbi:MAG: mechanosensitive ion channel family protein [Gemmatimonadota bacterium]|nr:MAG: mechanosensitive ion channel family protein [Gemmatimonadota bacterium]